MLVKISQAKLAAVLGLLRTEQTSWCLLSVFYCSERRGARMGGITVVSQDAMEVLIITGFVDLGM